MDVTEYLLFEQHLQGKRLFASWNRAKKKANVLKKIYEEVKNNKTIIEFSFHMTWRIMQIVEAVNNPAWPITFSLICIILHIILNLIQ